MEQLSSMAAGYETCDDGLAAEVMRGIADLQLFAGKESCNVRPIAIGPIVSIKLLLSQFVPFMVRGEN